MFLKVRYPSQKPTSLHSWLLYVRFFKTWKNLQYNSCFQFLSCICELRFPHRWHRYGSVVCAFGFPRVSSGSPGPFWAFRFFPCRYVQKQVCVYRFNVGLLFAVLLFGCYLHSMDCYRFRVFAIVLYPIDGVKSIFQIQKVFPKRTTFNETHVHNFETIIPLQARTANLEQIRIITWYEKMIGK